MGVPLSVRQVTVDHTPLAGITERTSQPQGAGAAALTTASWDTAQTATAGAADDDARDESVALTAIAALPPRERDGPPHRQRRGLRQRDRHAHRHGHGRRNRRARP